jgi:3',5'-cyclic AMP phosphodiesterase CpdA
MALNFRFAAISDLHIGLPHTIWDNPSRFHLIEISIPALETALKHLEQLNLDFLLLPGDLTQHGEAENHSWLQNRLAQLPFPVYVVPGNHDVPVLLPENPFIGWADFPHYYQPFGYQNPQQHYYTCQVLPGVRLIGLNSNQFNDEAKQVGRLDAAQLTWLEQVLADAQEEMVLVMVHHNVVEHLPGQSRHPLGSRYMLQNAPELLSILRRAGVKLVFTGHLHVQDIAENNGIWDITTGSLVSYPHPYRVFEVQTDSQGRKWLQVESHRIPSLPDWPNLKQVTRDWVGERSRPFMLKLLTLPPVNLSLAAAEAIAPSLHYFWADLACGDNFFHFPDFPPAVRQHFESFSAIAPNGTVAALDNHIALLLSP